MLISLLLHAAGLSVLSVAGTHDALPDSDDGEISQLDIFQTFTPPTPPPEQAAPTPPPPPPQVAQAPEPPPPPPPADLDLEKVRLGIDEGAPDSKVWKGAAVATEHHATKSEVDQAAHAVEPGVPGPAQAGDPGPEAPMGPPEPPRDQTPQNQAPDQPQPATQPAPDTAPQPAPPDPAPQSPAPQPEQQQPPQPQPEQPQPQQLKPQQPLEQQPLPQQTQPQQPVPVPAGDSPVEFGPPQPDEVQPKPQQPEPLQDQPQQLAPTQPKPPVAAAPPVAQTPPAAPAQLVNGAAHKPATPKSNSPDAQPGQKADDESAASSVTESLVYHPGHPLAGKGLQVRTVNPRWGVTTMLTSSPRNTIVRIRFARSGKVLKAAFLDGGTGYSDIDGPLLDAVYRWIAQGEVLKKIPTGDPQAGLNFDIKFIMQQ